MLYVLKLEMFDNEGSMPVDCLLYEDTMNADIHKLYTYPKVMDTICEMYDVKIIIVKGQTKYGNTTEELILPVCIPNSEAALSKISVSTELQNLLQQPDTAIQAILSGRSDIGDNTLEILYDNFKFIRSTKKNTKVVVGKEHFLDESLAEVMITNRPMFSIQPEKNIDIFQNSPTDQICIALPSVYEIMESPTCISTLDVLYLTAPYRLETKVSKGYMSILHTPFFRNSKDISKVYSQSALNGVDPKFRWLFGVARNNMLPIQPSEKQLADNLETLYYEDVTINMEAMLTGIFYQSQTGRLLQKLEGLSKSDFIQAFQMFLSEMDSFVKCTVQMEDVFDLDDNVHITKQILLDLFSGRLFINQEGAMNLIANTSTSNHMVDCNSFVFPIVFENLNDGVIVQGIIDNGFISKHMYEFMSELCKIAYRINWGHSATTKAIPGLISSDRIGEFDNKMVTRLNEIASGKGTHRDIFKGSSFDDDDDDDDYESEDIEASFNQYLSNITITRIKNSPDGLRMIDDQGLLDALTPKERIVERWRVVNGEFRLSNFINKAFTLYHDPKLLIQAFIKLLRWGEERKPTMLVFPEYPEIQTVFDLNESVELQNIYLVSEKDIILKNGCRYSLISALYTEAELINSKEPVLVGFMLAEDYGKIQKYYIASWSDMANLVSEDHCDIENLKLQYGDITNLFSEHNLIEDDLAGADFFISEDKIEQSVALNCQANMLSECALLVEKGITKSSEFIKHTKQSAIITTRDKQYDILHTYIKKLSVFYSKEHQRLANLASGATANDLIELIKTWISIGSESAKPLHNEVVGEAILNKLDLSGAASGISTHAYTKFKELNNVAIVVDMEMNSGLDTIQFTNKTMASLSNMLQNKIILCMGHTTIDNRECRVFFRDPDLSVSVLQLKKNQETGKSSPIIYKYPNVKQVLDKLKGTGFYDAGKVVYYVDKTLEGSV